MLQIITLKLLQLGLRIAYALRTGCYISWGVRQHVLLSGWFKMNMHANDADVQDLRYQQIKGSAI